MSRNTKNYRKLPYNKKLVPFAKKLRKAGNLSEVLLWNILKNKKFCNLDFDRQKIIGDYIVDFYCSSINLVIEIDGYATHDKKIEEDKNRGEFLISLGIRVIRVLDIDVKKDINQVLGQIKTQIETTPSGVACHPSKEGN